MMRSIHSKIRVHTTKFNDPWRLARENSRFPWEIIENEVVTNKRIHVFPPSKTKCCLYRGGEN